MMERQEPARPTGRSAGKKTSSSRGRTASRGGKKVGRLERALTDHDEIREWAEERGAVPSCVKGTGRRGDVGMIRLDFPGYSGEESLQEVSWDDWFEKFDERNLQLIVQDETAGGRQSNFNKLISRGSASGRERARAARSRFGTDPAIG